MKTFQYLELLFFVFYNEMQKGFMVRRSTKSLQENDLHVSLYKTLTLLRHNKNIFLILQLKNHCYIIVKRYSLASSPWGQYKYMT